MTTTKNEQADKSTTNFLTSLLWNIGVPTLVVILGLFIEYKSGVFQQVNQSNKNLDDYYLPLSFIIIMMIATILFTKDSLTLWLRQRLYLREQLALLLLFTLISATLLLIASLITGIMPWAIPLVLYHTFITRTLFQLDTRWIDYAFLTTLYFILVWTLGQLHKNWRGLKSTEQYRHEQHSETPNYIIEGANEFYRLAKNEYPLQVYTETNSKLFIPQLEPIKDTLAWKDQAKELIRLSSSSYSFDLDSSWHDKENCWAGRNVNTGELVFLHPRQGEISENDLKQLFVYIERIASNEMKVIGEIIIATKVYTNKPIVNWRNIDIRYETEGSLLDHLIDFKDYFNDIKRRASINHLPDSDLTLNDVYVPSLFLSQNNEKQSANIEEYLNIWLGEPGQRQIALLGEYGQGKSTATLMWAYHLINEKSSLRNRIPILIELRGTSPRNLTPLQFLGAWAAQYSINPQSLLRLLIAGRIVLVFEGFDEMALVGDVEMRLKHFRTLWQFSYPNAKILITGRPNFFLDEEEMIAALGISKPVGERPYCEAVRLAPFNSEQIKEALRTYKQTVKDQIHTLVEKNARFRELVSRPSLLHIVAVLWERERLVEKVDKLTSAFVMDLFIRHSYRRQGLKELDSPEFMALTTLEREYFMTGIAACMAAKRLPNQITSTQLNETISDLINTIPESVSTESSAISGETTQPLRIRLQDTEFGVEHVKTDVRACGLLADDPAATGTFRFGHKSFMEYLVASVIAERIQNKKSEKAKAILKATYLQIEDILLLPVAIDFLSELLVGIQDDQEVDHKIIEASIAKRLFSTIIGESAIRRFMFRPAIFTESLIQGLGRKLSRSRRSRLRLFIWLLPMFITVLPFSLVMSRLQENRSTSTSLGVSIDSLTAVMICTFIPMTAIMMLIQSSLTVRRKLQLWNHLCKKLGVKDTILHEIAGTSIIPWVREQPFDFNYRNISDSEDESDLSKEHKPESTA